MSFITLAPDMTLAYLLTQRLMEHIQNETDEVWQELEHNCDYPDDPTNPAEVCLYYWNWTRHVPLAVSYLWVPAKVTPDMDHCMCHTTITLYDEWTDLHYGAYIESYQTKQA